MKKSIIGYVGMSHLGLCYSAVAAEKNNSVIAFDFEKNIIDKIVNDENYIYEHGLKKIIKKNINKKLKFTNNINDLKKCNLIFISEDIPTDKNGNSSLKSINIIINKITKLINKSTTIVILSQVQPGFTRSIHWVKQNLYYQVETLIFGKAIYRASKPERIIVGKHHLDTKINPIYSQFLKKFNSPIVQMNYESAEMAKISINMFLISTITTTNLLSDICEKIGANWSSIIPSLKLDKRIGKHSYIYPGLGLSGGNLERDLTTLSNLSKNLLNDNNISKTFLDSSKKNKLWVNNILKKYLQRNNKLSISILGLSYKENTNSIKNSPSMELLKKFPKINMSVYDPIIKMQNFQNLNFKKNILGAIKNSDILLIMNKSKEFNKISKKMLISNMKKKIIIDPFGVMKHLNLYQEGFTYYFKGDSN